MTVLRHILSILILPFTVTILVPGGLLGGGVAYPLSPAGMFGVLLIAGGLALIALTIRYFATSGHGTLAPWDPPRHLVVRGVYRHVRNPMITGVLLVVVGESLLFASKAVGVWAGTLFVINAVYIPLLEEPGLLRRFGEDYRVYKQHVPRWVPRATPWIPPASRLDVSAHRA
jgi:protein-S-isoprenylcysteine O-methyltransferase Ste14